MCAVGGWGPMFGTKSQINTFFFLTPFLRKLTKIYAEKNLLQSLMVNQKRISATETKLIPRQSPQNPPKPEMKSSQVIFGDLSNSENDVQMVIINSSHHRRSALQKRCSQLQYPSHRHHNAVPPEKNVKIIFYNLAHLGQRLYDLSFIHGVRVLRSQWAHYLVDIVRGLVSIGLENAWSPHCQRW